MKKFFSLLIILCLFAGCSMQNDNYVNPPNDGQGIQPEDRTLTEQSVIANTGDLDNKLYGWGFKKEVNKAPSMPTEYIDLLKAYDGYYLGNTDKKVLYLTFDEGYENGYTDKILDVLKKTKTPAAFFVTGPYLENEEDIVNRMIDEGHIIGNHTVNHPSLPSISDEAIVKELDGLNSVFKEKYGQKMNFFRPPRGEFSERTLSVTKDMGYKTIFWSSAYVDWDVNNQKGSEYALKQFTSQLHNGSIILLHAVSKDNAEALEKMINTAKKQGYKFLSLDNL
ncbi:MAG: delta-lactam-biosynthetic de-N-acetylase [Eubacteriales bacterium]|nr:delta-lactam-biosynthetic de-N-acetylase [Eubacteriales bacterium]